MEEEICAICLEPTVSETGPQELFTHRVGTGSHSLHAACQLQYIQAREASGARTISCMICREDLGTPAECRAALPAENIPFWEQFRRNASEVGNSIISYLPSRQTLIISGCLTVLITLNTQRIPDPNQMGAVIRHINLGPILRTGIIGWYIVRPLLEVNQRIRNRRGRGGTRRNKKMSRRMRGGTMHGVINSERTLMDFLKVIAKLNESNELKKHPDPYYIVFTELNRKRALLFLESLDIDTSLMVDAHLEDLDESDDDYEGFNTVQPELMGQ